MPKPKKSTPKKHPHFPPPTMLDSDPHHQEPQDHQETQETQDHQEPRPPHPTPTDVDAANQPDPDPIPTTAAALPDMAPRKPLGGKLKKRLSEKQRAAAEQKLSFLLTHLRLVPFSPPPPAAFAEKHQAALRALGLYDFACIDFSGEPRADLVKPLIAFYDPHLRRSFVRGVRLAVSRADLARALSLPVKSASKSAEETAHKLDDEAAAAVIEFMAGYVLLQFQGDDACILPAEVAAAEQLVRDGSAHKVDWAGLIWFLVEKEMLEAPKKVDGACHYAAHLQRLIQFQRSELFESREAAEEGEKTETVPEVSVSVDVEMEEEDGDGEGDGDVKSKSLEELESGAAAAAAAAAEEEEEEEEKDAPGLSLGIGGADVDMDWDADANAVDVDVDDGGNGDAEEDDAFEECKSGEEVGWRIEDEKNDEGMVHGLRQCNSSGFGSMEFEKLSKGDVEMREEVRFDDGFSGKMGSLDRMTSTDLLQAMNTMPVTYSVAENAHDPSSGEFLAMGADAHKNLCGADLGAGGSFFFGNSGKRHMGDIDEYNGNAQPQQQFPQGNHPKRMRSSSNSSASLGSPEFNANFIAPMQSIWEKASICYAQKEQELQNALMEKQYLNELLRQKDDIIQSLDRSRIDQHNKWQGDLGRFEHELNVMAQLVVGYKKALKQSRVSFAEYRKKFPCDKPLYSDVAGSGGLVLSVKELERQRLEKEQQTLAVVQEMIDKFNLEWSSKLDEYEGALQFLGSRKDALIREVDLLKERRSMKVTTPATEE